MARARRERRFHRGRRELLTQGAVVVAGEFGEIVADAVGIGQPQRAHLPRRRQRPIDLRAATLQYEYGGGGWVSYAYGIHGGYTIANNVVIEINASPSRLDMDWRWIDYALEKGVLLSVNPDAHSFDDFNCIKYGVLVSQKGGLTKALNVSSMNQKEFETFLQQRKSLKGIG